MNKEKSEKIAGISARIAEILEKEGLTRNDFASKLGYARSQTVYDIINGKSAPSFDFFYRFVISEYSETYDTDWLIAGKGEMLKPKDTSSSENADSHTSNSCKDTQKPSNIQDNSEFSLIHKQLLDSLLEKTEEIGRLKEQINILMQYDNIEDFFPNHTSIPSQAVPHVPNTP